MTSSANGRPGVDPALASLLLLTLCFWSVIFFRPLFFGGDDWFTFHHLAETKPAALLNYLFTSHGKHYYPLTLGLVFLQLAAFGLHYWPFQVVGLLIHAAVTALLFLVLARHVPHRRVLFLSVGFFSLNAAYYPQAVGWVMGQSTMLTLLFMLSALLSLEHYRDGRRGYLILTILCCVLADFSSGSGLVSPLIVLVYLLIFRRREGASPGKPGVAVPALALGLTQAALVAFYFMILKRENILSENLYFLSSNAVTKIIELVSAGVTSLLFTSVGGKTLLLLFDIDPLRLLRPASPHLPLIGILCLIALLFLAAGAYCCSVALKSRSSNRQQLSEEWRTALFGIVFIFGMYGIRALGRMDTQTMTDFMVNHQYRYEPMAGLAMVVSFVLGSIRRGRAAGWTAAFKRAIFALAVGFLVVINLPAVWAGGQEYPEDRDFVTAFRALTDNPAKGGENLPDLPYIFHDDIRSTFLLSDIRKMDERRPSGVVFSNELPPRDITDEKARRFYLIYFPQRLIP